jgi:hypothetical protein
MNRERVLSDAEARALELFRAEYEPRATARLWDERIDQHQSRDGKYRLRGGSWLWFCLRLHA